jgi:hypothetical protein
MLRPSVSRILGFTLTVVHFILPVTGEASAEERERVGMVAVVEKKNSAEVASMAVAVHRQLSGRHEMIPLREEIDLLGGKVKASRLSLQVLEGEFKKGVEQARAGKHQDAVRTQRSVCTRLDRTVNTEDHWELFTRAKLHLGRSLWHLKDNQGAIQAFQRILRTRPDMQPVQEHPPGMLKLWEQARKLLKKQKTQLLEIDTSKKGAKVYLEGALIGRTPFSGRFPRGGYHLKVYHSALGTIYRQVKLGKDPVSLYFDRMDEALRLSGSLPVFLSRGSGVVRNFFPGLASRLKAGKLVVVERVVVNKKRFWVVTLLENEGGRLNRVRTGHLEAVGDKLTLAMELARFLSTGEEGRVRQGPASAAK